MFSGLRPSDRQIGGFFILVAQLRIVAATGLANPIGPTRQSDACPESCLCIPGCLSVLIRRNCTHLPSGQWMAAAFFAGIFKHVRLHVQVRPGRLQPTVPILHGLHLADQRRIHAARFRPPLLKCRVAHAVPAPRPALPHAAASRWSEPRRTARLRATSSRSFYRESPACSRLAFPAGGMPHVAVDTSSISAPKVHHGQLCKLCYSCSNSD